MRKSLTALTLSAALYALAAPGTGGSRTVDTGTELPPAPIASLAFEDARPVITGSVASLFQTDLFTGSNRSEKTARARPETDIAEFSKGFDAMRVQVAQAREAEAQAAAAAPRVAVAAVDPSMINTDALRAIGVLTGDNVARDPSIPRPVSVPDTLAYARANTPATDFTPQHDWDERQQWCMATGIYFEARGESYRGQVAVAQVIMNRVAHDNYPDTICGVVYQNQHRRNACQFSFACDGIPDRVNERTAWAKAQEITQEVLNERIYLTEVADATHYHATYVRPHWARNMTRLSQVGLHVFYKFRDGWKFG